MSTLVQARRVAIRALLTVGAGVALAVAASGVASGRSPASTVATAGFRSRVFASGSGIGHPTPGGVQRISQPDDITELGDHIFVGFQNGVGPQGQASSSGNRDSTVVEFDLRGSTCTSGT